MSVHAYGSLDPPRVPPAPTIGDSRNAASLEPASPAARAAAHPIALTDNESC
jgi:hypothetical protein